MPPAFRAGGRGPWGHDVSKQPLFALAGQTAVRPAVPPQGLLLFLLNVVVFYQSAQVAAERKLELLALCAVAGTSLN